MTKFKKINIYIGMILIASSFIPAPYLINNTLGGMYSPFFRSFSPAIYHLVILFVSYLIAGIVVYLFIKKIELFDRLASHYASTQLFIIGNTVIILYLVVRVFASTVPGGGVPMAISLLGAYPVAIAKLILFVAIARVFIGTEPRPV